MDPFKSGIAYIDLSGKNLEDKSNSMTDKRTNALAFSDKRTNALAFSSKINYDVDDDNVNDLDNSNDSVLAPVSSVSTVDSKQQQSQQHQLQMQLQQMQMQLQQLQQQQSQYGMQPYSMQHMMQGQQQPYGFPPFYGSPYPMMPQMLPQHPLSQQPLSQQQQPLSQQPQPLSIPANQDESSTSSTILGVKRSAPDSDNSSAKFVPNKKKKLMSLENLIDTITAKRSGKRVSYKCSNDYKNLTYNSLILFKAHDNRAIEGSRIEKVEELIRKIKDFTIPEGNIEITSLMIRIRMLATWFNYPTTKISANIYEDMKHEWRQLVNVLDAYVRIRKNNKHNPITGENEEKFISNLKERATFIFNLFLHN
jgi:hypothetical protein